MELGNRLLVPASVPAFSNPTDGVSLSGGEALSGNLLLSHSRASCENGRRGDGKRVTAQASTSTAMETMETLALPRQVSPASLAPPLRWPRSHFAGAYLDDWGRRVCSGVLSALAHSGALLFDRVP